MTDVSQAASQVVVNVKSAWASKVNWAAGLTAFVTTLNEILPLVPPTYQHYVTTAIVILGGIVTIYLKTFQTASVTPSSLPKIPVVTDEQATTAGLNNQQLSKVNQ